MVSSKVSARLVKFPHVFLRPQAVSWKNIQVRKFGCIVPNQPTHNSPCQLIRSGFDNIAQKVFRVTMADPLSIIGGISSVIQISQAVVGYIKAAKGAKEERKRLIVVINSTTAICQSLLDTAEMDPDEWTQTLRSLTRREAGPLCCFKESLESLQKKLSPERKRTTQLNGWTSTLRWPFEQDELRKIIADIEGQKSLLSLALANDNIKLSMAILHTTQDLANQMKTIQMSQEVQETASHGILANVDAMSIRNEQELQRSRVEEAYKKKQMLLSQMTTIDFDANHADISSRRTDGTGNWLLNNHEYISWRDENYCRTLWCPGLPGAGKTILTSLVIDSLRRSKTNRQSVERPDCFVGTAGVYCSYQNSDSASNIMGSILRQLCDPLEQLPVAAQESAKDSSDMVQKIISLFSLYGKLYLVIDALDECSDSNSLLKQTQKLLEAAKEGQSNTELHILITGRHNATLELHRYLIPDARLDISSDESDVRVYLQQDIRKHSQLSKWVLEDGDFEKLVVESILTKLSGMFLLARLYMDILAHIPTKRGVRKALKTLPTGVHDTYHEAWNRLLGQKTHQAELGKRILLWVVHAARPLRQQELQHALAVEEGDKELDREGLLDVEALTSFCTGLVIINERTNLVSLVHPTTQEYFDDRKSALFPHAHEEIAKVCVTYLRMKPFSDEGALPSIKAFQQRWASHRFLGYAAANCGFHTREAGTASGIQRSLFLLKDEKSRLAASQALILNTIGTRDWGTEWPEQSKFRMNTWESEFADSASFVNPLHVASCFGLVEPAKQLVQEGTDVNALDGTNGTALHWALFGGHTEILTFLLESGADANIERDQSRLRRWPSLGYFTLPLSIAAYIGNTRAIETLLYHGADVNKRQTKNSNETALFTAFHAREHEAAKLLLENGADINIEPRHIMAVVIHGDFESLKMVVEKGANKQQLQEALARAASAGQFLKVSYLLGHGADPNGFREDDTALVIHTPNISDGEESVLWETATPLVYCIAQHSNNPASDFLRCFQLLLESGADVNRISARRYFFGDDFITSATENIYSLPTGRKTTPLLTASYFGRLIMARMLVERGADINFCLGGQNTALTQAIRAEGFEGISSKTEHSWSSSLQTRETLSTLIELGANIELCSSEDRDRIAQLLAMSDEDLETLAELQRLVEQPHLGQDIYHQKSFRKRGEELKAMVAQGADVGLLPPRDKFRAERFLTWTEEDINSLDVERDAALASIERNQQGPL